MKPYILSFMAILAGLVLYAQSPQKVGYQAVIRNSQGKLVQSASVSIRLTVLQGSVSGTAVYTEVHNTTTNINGLVSINIGDGNTSDSLSAIDWAAGPYFLQTETDPAGGANYTITGISQLISVPYALYAGGGDYNSLSNKPDIDGSETKIRSGFNINVTGTGTTDNPYVVNYGKDPTATVVITSSQVFTVPENITRMKVELWGGAGGGGGAGAYSYSLLVNGGDGGTGGYASREMTVSQSSYIAISIGDGGYPGNNATYYYYWSGDTDGGNGGDSQMGILVAKGGNGGKRGSYQRYTVHGEAGTMNSGDITGYAEPSNLNILNVFQGIERSYIHTRTLTSRSGSGGMIYGYSSVKTPTQGEAGCAVITLWEK